MSEQDNGRPAFPIIGTHEQVLEIGLTLRDYFAAKASEEDVKAQGELLRAKYVKKLGLGILPDSWRVTARYMHADAMLKAREA